jgi:acyl-CoA reductase-like NAD-dependent aldehyde dehydrogenase
MGNVVETTRIGRSVIRPGDRATIDVINPANTTEVIGRVPALTAEDVARAYSVASSAQAGWDELGLIGRGAVLFRAAAEVRARAGSLAELIVRENGKLRAEANGEVGKVAEFFEYYAGFGRHAYGALLDDARPQTRTTSERRPVGTVLLITPWNDPFLTPVRKLAPALISGNTVVLKPATDTPLIALALAEILSAAGLPDGVLTVVTGRSADISAALLEGPHLAAVSFTGSTQVGYELRRQLAHRNVRLQTEMGGKNAAVVTDSANIELTVAGLMAASFAQAGQRCTATSRLIVSAGIAEELVVALTEAIAALRPGGGLDHASSFGPLINRTQVAEVLSFIDTAKREGGEILCGGAPLTEGALAEGAFVSPTLIDGVGERDTVWLQEIFGPVLAMRRLDLAGGEFLREAIRLTNDSRYGLAASIYTDDLSEASAFMAGAEVGQVGVNLPTSGWDVHHPFGGFDDSGSAFKEQGTEALNFYTRVKTTAVRYATPFGKN